MNHSFDIITSLQYRLKAAIAEAQGFKSGKKYQDMQEAHEKEVRSYERRIKDLESELAKAYRDIVNIRNQWFEVFGDLEKEHSKELSEALKKAEQMENRALRAERQRDEALDKIKEQRIKIYEVETELEEEKGKNLKLKAQLNRDYENSSIPSSKSIKHKKIPNSREKTGRKPGGQPGHAGHRRQKQTPDKEPVCLLPPQEAVENPDFKKTAKTIVKQLVNVRVMLDVTEYHADVYYNAKTGERVHADFPSGVMNDVNYGGSVKAFLFLLNNDCCTSIDKSRKFLSDLTGGKLNISKGMISSLCREFAGKSEQERKKAFADMLLSPVMHIDCTNAKVNGKGAYVYVCSAPGGEAIYIAREHKGHEGVKGTPAENYQGTLVHDHDKTFYNYGTDHQECLAHILRYLKDSMDNEPERTWNKEMHTLVREMIHYRNGLETGADCDPAEVSRFEERYLEILKKAEEEYINIPANEYYKEGYNLFVRMKEYISNHLLFLHDCRVPPTNNEAERLLRSYKRKQQQAVSFRSFESIEYLCQCMSMLVMMRQEEGLNLFDRVSRIFG